MLLGNKPFENIVGKGEIAHNKPIPYLHQTSSNLAIRTTLCIAGIIYHTCNLVTEVNVSITKMPSTNVFNELCVKISLLRSILKKL